MKKKLGKLTPHRDRVSFGHKGVRRTELVIAVKVDGERGQIATKFFGWHDPRDVTACYEVSTR